MSESDSGVVRFDELPALPGSGLRHAWDVWGPGDNLGTLNRLTGPAVAAAAATVRTGERVGLSLPLGLPDPPFFGRKKFRHSFTPDDITAALDAQGSALRHGDILCVRTGWVDQYLTLDADARRALAATMVDITGFTSAGLAGSEEMSRFLWDSGVAAGTPGWPRCPATTRRSRWSRPTPPLGPCTDG